MSILTPTKTLFFIFINTAFISNTYNSDPAYQIYAKTLSKLSTIFLNQRERAESQDKKTILFERQQLSTHALGELYTQFKKQKKTFFNETIATTLEDDGFEVALINHFIAEINSL